MDYLELESALASMDAEMEPSEVHGTMCGLLCANDTLTSEQAITTLFESFDNNNLLHKETAKLVSELYEITLQQMNDPTCDFHLLLPPEEQSGIQDLIGALAQWCQGFLLGLSAGGIQNIDALPEEAKEITADFIEIARAENSYELEGSEEEDEESFQQLLEYVRVGVLLINEVIHPSKAPPINNTTIH